MPRRGLPEFVEEETLAAAPLGVEADGDGHGEGGLGEDVGQGRAVQVVAQHVLGVVVRVQVPGPEHLAIQPRILEVHMREIMT